MNQIGKELHVAKKQGKGHIRQQTEKSKEAKLTYKLENVNGNCITSEEPGADGVLGNISVLHLAEPCHNTEWLSSWGKCRL